MVLRREFEGLFGATRVVADLPEAAGATVVGAVRV